MLEIIFLRFCYKKTKNKTFKYFRRKLMNKRKSKLEKFRNCDALSNNDNAEVKRLKILKEVMLRYLEIYDLDNGTIHKRVFDMLYLSSKTYTYSVICETLGISKNTLIRYVDKYEKLAEKIVKKFNF